MIMASIQTGGQQRRWLLDTLNIDPMGRVQLTSYVWKPVSVFKRDHCFKKVKNTVSRPYQTHYLLVPELYDIWLLQKSNIPLKSEIQNH